MPRNRQPRRQVAQFQKRFLRPRRGMIGFRRMFRVALARLSAQTVFADIVQKSRASGLLTRPERSALFRRQPRDILYMFAQRLETPVVSFMRDKLHDVSSFRYISDKKKGRRFPPSLPYSFPLPAAVTQYPSAAPSTTRTRAVGFSRMRSAFAEKPVTSAAY